jgi:DNA-binding CsgD family transcriptional regulator
MLAQAERNYGETVADLQESLALCRQLNFRTLIPLVIHSLAYAAQLQGDLDQAQTLFIEALHLYEKNSQFGVARCLVGLATIAEATGDWLVAAHLFGAAATQHDNVKGFLEPGERDSYDQSLVMVRAKLGEKPFHAAWVEGRAMSLAQALTAFNAEKPPVVPAAPPVASAPTVAAPAALATSFPGGLSERELEVLRLLTRGLSYTEIADQLVISSRTVNRHLTSIYTKLNVTSRHAATRFALDHGLA